MFKHRLAVYAAIATVTLFAGASTALAFDAVAKSAVNVRTGPGKTFGIADQLEAGRSGDGFRVRAFGLVLCRA